MELRQYFDTIRKWLWLIILSTTVATVAAFLATRQQPAIYQASATMMTGRAIEKSNPTSEDFWLSQDLAQTYVEMAKRRLVRNGVMEALGLGWLPEYSVSRVPNTLLLEIRVVDTSPERAQAVANELANQLIEQTPSSSQREQQDRREFVTEKLQKLEVSIQETEVRIEELDLQLETMFSARQIADTRNQIVALEQKLNGYEISYASLLNFLEGGTNTLQVVEVADLPTQPIGPNKLMTIALAAAIGFLLALGAAFLLDYLDDTLKNPDDIKKALGISALGTIMVIEGERPGDRLVTMLQPKSPIAEAYRIMRTNLQFSALDNPPRTLLVTSSSPTEGKSTTLANLAVAMAQQGQRVVIVDTDLRRPSQHRIFGLPNNVGLTSALLHERPTADGFLLNTGQKNLQLMTTGPLPPNPAELLGAERFGALIKSIRQEADVVLLDSPPALAVTDAAILARQVDGVVLVVDSGSTRRQWAISAKEQLENVGGRVLGVALNRLKPEGSSYYYYYYYYQRYGYDQDGDESDLGGPPPSLEKPRGWRRLLPGASSGR